MNMIKSRTLIPMFVIVCCFVAAPAQQKDEPAHKLVQFQMAIMKKGPKWGSTKEQDRTAILQQHVGNVKMLLDSGKAVIAGPFGDDTDLSGIFILRAASTDEAKTWIDAIRQ